MSKVSIGNSAGNSEVGLETFGKKIASRADSSSAKDSLYLNNATPGGQSGIIYRVWMNNFVTRFDGTNYLLGSSNAIFDGVLTEYMRVNSNETKISGDCNLTSGHTYKIDGTDIINNKLNINAAEFSGNSATATQLKPGNKIIDGYLSVNTSTFDTRYPLYISGQGVGDRYWYSDPTYGDTYAHADITAASISCYGKNFLASRFMNVSDKRIKKNIIEINDDEALIQFRKLKPCKYNYIDNIERGYEEVYGFIAHEVKEIIPNSCRINNSKEVMPDIYKLAVYNNNIITFNEPHDIIDSEYRIKLIFENNEILVNYNILDELRININLENIEPSKMPSNEFPLDNNGNLLPTNIFVYGREVDDMHLLNKEAIFTCNYSGITGNR